MRLQGGRVRDMMPSGEKKPGEVKEAGLQGESGLLKVGAEGGARSLLGQRQKDTD